MIGTAHHFDEVQLSQPKWQGNGSELSRQIYQICFSKLIYVAMVSHRSSCALWITQCYLASCFVGKSHFSERKLDKCIKDYPGCCNLMPNRITVHWQDVTTKLYVVEDVIYILHWNFNRSIVFVHRKPETYESEWELTMVPPSLTWDQCYLLISDQWFWVSLLICIDFILLFTLPGNVLSPLLQAALSNEPHQLSSTCLRLQYFSFEVTWD